jgi:hypothetical protein
MSKSIGEARRQLLERVHTEGVLAAYQAALDICNDPKAPSPAKATAAATLFRVAGYFDRKDAGEASKEPHEMSLSELEQQIAELAARASKKPESIFD